MTTTVKLWLGAGSLGMVVLLASLFVAHERAIGARDAELKSLHAENAALQVVIAADSTALVRIDTVKVFRRVVQTDTVLQHLIDTAVVHHTDTVTVTREVLVEAKAALDYTKDVADACCKLAHDYKARNAVLDSTVKAMLKNQPLKVKPWVDRAEGAGACVAAVWAAGKIKS